MQSQPADYWACMAAPRVRMLRCICGKVRGKTYAPPEDLSRLPRAEDDEMFLPEGPTAQEAGEAAEEENVHDS
eukprot:9465433-Karenia_brevis.AAC.1